jgi:N,N'-diacetyllegionaminate synthase
MKIGNRQIGPDHPPYIIAELGVNHDGSVDRALQLVDAAADAGADAVKLQLFKADLLMSKAAKLAAYQKAAGESDPVEMLRRLELSIDQMAPIVEKAHARGIHAIVTVFSVELVEHAERLPWDAYKTASPDIIHRPLLERLMATGKPLIVSTGASTMEEVLRTREWMDDAANRLVFLQCVSSYPAPKGSEEFAGITALKAALDTPIGYSDHAVDERSGLQAVLSGACVLEKHLTLDVTAAGPDHAASLEPRQFADYAELARNSTALRTSFHEAVRDFKILDPELALDPITKHVLPIEQDVRTVSRQSITATRNLPTGHRLTRTDLTFKRPGAGIPPFRLDEILGRPLARLVEADMPLMDADITPL